MIKRFFTLFMISSIVIVFAENEITKSPICRVEYSAQ